MEPTFQNENSSTRFDRISVRGRNVDSEGLADRANEVAHTFTDEIVRRYGDLSEQLKNLSDKSSDVVRNYPLYSVLGAAAVGMLLGSMIRKKIA